MRLLNPLDARKAAGLGVCLALSGCPQLMADGFSVNPGTSGGTAGAMTTGHRADDAGADDDAGLGGSGPGSGGTSALGNGGTVATTGGCRFTEFAPPERVSGLGVASEQWSPSLSADSLTMYFSGWDTSEKLYVATRSDRGRNFSVATRLTLLDTALSPPASPFVSGTGLEMYFLANGSSATDRDIYVAARDNSTTFSNPQRLDINSTSPEGTPWLSPDGLTLLFSSARPDGVGDVDIWKATREVDGDTFSSLELLAGVNSPDREESAALSNDGLTVYFATNRASPNGNQDIWYATRASVDQQFTSPTALAGLNSDYVETDLVLSSDETEIFFVTDRSGTPQIWRARRDCK